MALLPTACPKPPRGTKRRQKNRGKRLESKTAKSVRALCVERDGECLFATRGVETRQESLLLGPCDGPSEWAHVGKHRRCFTRGQAPEVRHTTAGSAQMCRRHHRAYDAHVFDVLPTDSVKGMNGAYRVRRAA